MAPRGPLKWNCEKENSWTRRADTPSCAVADWLAWTMSKGHNRQVKTRFSSLDVCAMAQSLTPLVAGYRIANVYDVNPKTCAGISSLGLACSKHAPIAHTHPPPPQICAQAG
jgi:hypothetical protein